MASARAARRRPRRRPAIRCAARQPTVTSSRSRSNVFSPSTPRERSSSTAANGASAAGVEDLLGGHRPDAGQRVELLERRRIEVEEVAAGRARCAARRPPTGRDRPATARRCGRRRRGPSPGGGPIAARAVSTRGPKPPAAATRSATREPAGRRTTPGRATAPATSTTTSPSRPRPRAPAREPAAGCHVDGHARPRARRDRQPEGRRRRPRPPGRPPPPPSGPPDRATGSVASGSGVATAVGRSSSAGVSRARHGGETVGSMERLQRGGRGPAPETT